MRQICGLGLGAIYSMMLSPIAVEMPSIKIASPHDKPFGPLKRRPGRVYPHSSTRQQERNARQLAAGQISFIQHGPRA